MPSYQYRKSHCGDKTILRPSYLHNGISYTGKMASLYWIRALMSITKRCPVRYLSDAFRDLQDGFIDRAIMRPHCGYENSTYDMQVLWCRYTSNDRTSADKMLINTNCIHTWLHKLNYPTWDNMHIIRENIEKIQKLKFTSWRHQMETFSALLAICAGNSLVTVNSPHKGQWRGALMFSLICTWINRWGNNRDAGDLRRNRTHYDVIVMTPDSHCWSYYPIPCENKFSFCNLFKSDNQMSCNDLA